MPAPTETINRRLRTIRNVALRHAAARALQKMARNTGAYLSIGDAPAEPMAGLCADGILRMSSGSQRMFMIESQHCAVISRCRICDDGYLMP